MNKRAERVAVTSKSFSKNTDLRNELLAHFSDVRFNEGGIDLRGKALADFLSDRECAIIGLEPVDDALLQQLPMLRKISKYGVGLDKIDLPAIEKRQIHFAWKPGVNRRAVAELTLLFLLGSLRAAFLAAHDVRTGGWRQHVGLSLTGKTVGIVGLGNVGRDLVHLLKPFYCRILAYDIVESHDFCREHGVQMLSLDDVLQQSDAVTLHVPLDSTTREMVGASEINRMKPGSVLINTARGGIVNESALKAALKSGHLSAAAFDVFANEPPTDPELIALPQLFATPHIGGSAREAILAMGRAAIDGLLE